MRILITLMLLLAGAAQAEKACFLRYAEFEEKVPHMDLDLCPGSNARPEEVFCRIALSGADVLIYEFRHTDGEPCLARVDRYAFNDFVARFGVNYTRP
ncbi:hypothetical protein [Roseicella aerolata]|uniref:Uncharacterized protein n=1 Tax=Roseicella aerolata TaxID=2883479 RepID=A0A9X1IFV6_9PROT|nr:hypothetical protein [Roseicella aerolata]MCB4823875.1 hypothetical protein [Roseicella aerolata]